MAACSCGLAFAGFDSDTLIVGQKVTSMAWTRLPSKKIADLVLRSLEVKIDAIIRRAVRVVLDDIDLLAETGNDRRKS